MKKLSFLIVVLISGVAFSQNNISIVDFIKIKNNNQEEAFHYYEQNWEKFRKEAKTEGYIKSYSLIKVNENPKRSFDLIAITTYNDSDQLASNEENFQKVMKKVRPDGPSFFNDKRPKDFRESIYTIEASIKLANDPLESEILKLVDNITLFSHHYISADYDSLANAYTENGMILAPGANIIKGREAIKKRWILPEGVKVSYHKVSPMEIKIIADYAYDVGLYEGTTIRKDKSEVTFKGKYLIVWKKEDGIWKIYADAWNSVH